MSVTTPSRIPVASSEPANDGLDPRALWRTILRRRWMVIPFFAATVLVATIITLRQAKLYESTCTIIIDLAAPRVLEKDQVQEVVDTGTGSWYSREYYETQYKVIASHAVAERVVDRLQLGNNLKFLGLEEIQDPALRERMRAARDPVKLLQRRVKVEPVKESRLVRIRYTSPDPSLAALIANAYADAYIDENLSVKTSTTQNASEWLEQQLVDLEKKLDESGKALYEFKKSHDIVAASWEDRQGMVSQRLTAINDALTKARVRRAELEARGEAIRNIEAIVARGGGEVQGLPELGTDPTLGSLKMRFIEVRSECADLRVKYLDDHPRIEACEKRLVLAQKALQDEISSNVASAKQQYDEVVKTERNLVTLLDETKSDAFNLNQYEREYIELKRAYDNNQRLYDLVLKRLKDTGISGMLQVSNVRVLDRAVPASAPVWPDPRKNGALAVLLGLLGAIGLAFLVEYLDNSIISQEQVEEKLGLAFLGIVPSMPPNKDGTPQDLLVHSQPKSAVAECLRAVRTNLLFMSPEKPLRTILVTSSGPQEGKTTTATSLAITMTSSGNRVLLVDGDMRRPRLHRVFGIENTLGLTSMILGEGRLEEAVRPTAVPNLSVMTCGPVPPNPAELLHTAAFRRLLADLAARYDRVIIDSPPVGVVADAVVAATQVDGALMVLKAGRTSREVARHAVRQLRDVNAPLFGAVLNDLDLEDQKYGQYSYYYRYGYYYGDSKRRDEKRSPAATG